MKTYIVKVKKTVEYETTVTVRADSKDDANDLAKEKAATMLQYWSHTGTDYDVMNIADENGKEIKVMERMELPNGYWIENAGPFAFGIYTDRYKTEKSFCVAKCNNVPAMNDFAKSMNETFDNLQERLRVAVEALESIGLTTGRYGLNESYRELDRKESVAKVALEQVKGKKQ